MTAPPPVFLCPFGFAEKGLTAQQPAKCFSKSHLYFSKCMSRSERDVTQQRQRAFVFVSVRSFDMFFCHVDVCVCVYCASCVTAVGQDELW